MRNFSTGLYGSNQEIIIALWFINCLRIYIINNFYHNILKKDPNAIDEWSSIIQNSKLKRFFKRVCLYLECKIAYNIAGNSSRYKLESDSALAVELAIYILSLITSAKKLAL